LGGQLRAKESGRFEVPHVPAAIRERDRLIGAMRTPVLRDYHRICFEKTDVRPDGRSFLLILELILKAWALLASLRYAKRPSGPSGCASQRCLRCDPCQWKSHWQRVAHCIHSLKPHNASRAESPTGC